MTISPEISPIAPIEQPETETDEQKISRFVVEASLPNPEIVPNLDRSTEIHIHLSDNKRDNEIIEAGKRLQAQFGEHHLSYPIVFHLVGGRQIYVPTEAHTYERQNNN